MYFVEFTHMNTIVLCVVSRLLLIVIIALCGTYSYCIHNVSLFITN